MIVCADRDQPSDPVLTGFTAASAAHEDRNWRRLRRAAWAVLLVQLIGFVWFSTYEYLRFDESHDFGLYMQALSQIARGHLNPYSSLIGMSFWRNNGEAIMWPLAILDRIAPHPLAFVWLQDVVVVATEWFTFDWVCRILRRSQLSPRGSQSLAAAVAVLLVFNPWAWNTIAFDFHPHTIGALFLVLCGRDLWTGRRRRALVWAGAALLCGGSVVLCLAGVGLAGATALRDSRRSALWVVTMALIWFVVLTQSGSDGVGGHGLAAWYGYLAGTHAGHVGIGSVITGAVTHPSRLWAVIPARAPIAIVYLTVVGLFGMLSPWGAFPAAAVFLPTVLNADASFLTYTQSFQSWPAIPFVLVGSVSVVIWLASRREFNARTRRMLVTAWFGASAPICLSFLAALPAWLSVSGPTSAQLANAERLIPANAEIIGDDGTLGRFADWPLLYQASAKWDLLSPRAVPIRSRLVVFIITPRAGRGEPPLAKSEETVALALSLGAKPLVEADGVYVLEWHAPPGVRSVVIPQ